MPAEGALLGPDTRSKRRRFDLRRERFKRAAMRVERSWFAKPIKKDPPSFMDGSCAIANLVDRGKEALCNRAAVSGK